jgi:hypothetical protein
MSDVESRLENWGAALRERYFPHRCRSIEGRYVPERVVGDAWESKRKPRPDLDLLDAYRVEAAWREVEPRILKNLLSLHYIRQAPRDFVCRRTGIKHDRHGTQYLIELHKAQSAILGLLEVPHRTIESCM